MPVYYMHKYDFKYVLYTYIQLNCSGKNNPFQTSFLDRLECWHLAFDLPNKLMLKYIHRSVMFIFHLRINLHVLLIHNFEIIEAQMHTQSSYGWRFFTFIFIFIVWATHVRERRSINGRPSVLIRRPRTAGRPRYSRCYKNNTRRRQEKTRKKIKLLTSTHPTNMVRHSFCSSENY